ncbi:MAG: type IV secretory system conjugative DNA transfer family protein [Candidatus Pacearchaeota archaeon]
MTTLFNIIAAMLDGFVYFIVSLFPPAKKLTYDADFLPSSEILSSFNLGFCITGRKSLTIQDSFKNVLVIGGTGNFKSSGILIPSILNMRGGSSLVINDPSGELHLKTSGALAEAGYTIKVLNYNNPTISEGFNPLFRVKTASDIKKVSKMLIINSLGTGGKDPFWNLSSENLISLCCQYIINHTEEKYHTLANVYHLITVLSFAPEKIDKLFAQTNDSKLLSEYKSFISCGDKVMASILATCRAALSIFSTDENVMLITSHDSINIEEFRKQKIALFINTSTKDMRYFSVITSIFLEQFFGEIMSKLASRTEYPIFFLLDEASSLYFNNLQITVSNIRKSGAGILQIYQSASQLQDLYGHAVAKAITENSFARVYMTGQPIHVAQELEATLGKFEYLDSNKVRHVRSLMTADEIHESEESLILCGNLRAIRTRTIPYFQQLKLRLLTSISPYIPTSALPFSTPPLYQFEA